VAVRAERDHIAGPQRHVRVVIIDRLDPDGTQAALAFAAAGLPIVACSMPIAGVTAPATSAGCLLLTTG